MRSNCIRTIFLAAAAATLTAAPAFAWSPYDGECHGCDEKRQLRTGDALDAYHYGR